MQVHSFGASRHGPSGSGGQLIGRNRHRRMVRSFPPAVQAGLDPPDAI
jgi:hypothetical protein